MANIMSQLKLKNKASRNGFDLSKKRAFTAKIGELLPVYVREVMPGDKFNIKQEWFTRTMPLNTAAYTRIREYYDWFFVPFDQMWRFFNQFYSNMSDAPIAASDINTGNYLGTLHPSFTSAQVIDYLDKLRLLYSEAGPDVSGQAVLSNGLSDDLGYARAFGTGKLLWYLGYGKMFYEFASSLKDDPDGYLNSSDIHYSYNCNPFPLLAYQKIYNDFYRDQNWEKPQPWTFNVDYLGADFTTGVAPLVPLKDMDYETSTTMFDIRYANWNKDLFTGLLPNAQYGDVATISIIDEVSASKLVDYVSSAGYLSLHSGTLTMPVSGTVGLDLPTSGIVTSNNELKLEFSTSGGSTIPLDLHIDSNVANNIASRACQALNAVALRKLEALQKYKEILMSNTKSWNNVIESVYDVNVDNKLSSNVYFLKGFSGNVEISEVINQAFPDADQYADIAGKGVGVGRDSFEFDASWYGNRPGILMCIYHSSPFLDYATGGVNRFNMKIQFEDYANPIFDKIGMQSVSLRELTTSKTMYDAINGHTVDNFNLNHMLLGFAPRYIDYKTDYDDVVGAFCTTLGAWSAPISDNYLYNYVRSSMPVNFDPSNLITYQFFKINPAILNSIFANQVTNVHCTVDDDQFLINCNMDIKAVRNLDVNGLPY